MADPSKHLEQWKHNRGFLSIIPVAYPDWIVTAAFYVALQAVDTLLTHDKVSRVNSHDSRNAVLIYTRRYQQVWRLYQPLHDLSRRIRYLADPGEWVPVDQIETNVFRRYLYPIEASVEKLMGKSLELEPVRLNVST